MKRIFLIAALVIVVLAGAGWWYVFHTNAGINFLLARVASLTSPHIEAQGVEGTLAGPLRIKHILIDHKTVRIEAGDLLLDLTPSALLLGTIQIDAATIGRADVNVKKTDDTSSTAPKFLPGFLRLVVNNADVRSAHVVVYESFVQNAERARGNVRLTATRLSVTEAKIDSSPYNVSGGIAVFARHPIELDIAAHLLSPAPHGPPLDLSLALKGPVTKFRLDAELHAPSAAQFHGDFARNEDSWRLTGNVDSQHFAFDPWIDHPPFALQDLSVKIEATPNEMHIAGGVTVPEVDALPLQLDFRGQYAAQVIAITRGELRPSKSDMTIATAARIDLSAGRPVIAATAQWTNLRWPLRADYFVSPQGQVSLSGSLPFAIGVNADVKTQKNIGGRLLAHGELSSEAIAFDEMTLNVLDGEIKGAARLGFSPKREWQASVTGHNINPQPFTEQLPGRVDFKVDAQGAGLDPKADFAITLPSLRGVLRNEPLDGHGYVSHDAGGWNAKEFSLSLGQSRLTANGAWRQRIDLAWSLEVPALDKFIHDAKGSIRFSGTAHGSQTRPQIAGSLFASQLKYGGWNVEDISIAGNVDLSDQLASQLRLEAAKLGWGDTYLDTLRVRAQGKATAHEIELRGVTTKNGAFSKISTKLEGDYSKDIWRARIAPVEFADGTGAAPTVAASEGRLLWSAKHRSLTNLCLLWTTHKLCADGDWLPQGAWSASASSDALPLNVFDGTFPQKSKYQGSWQIQAKFSGSATSQWTGQAIVDVNNASLAYQAIVGAEELMRLGSGRVSVTVANDRYTGDVRIVTPGTTNIEASARVDRGGADFGASPLGGELHASTSDANVLPLIFPDLDHSAGDLTMQLHVAGTPSAPLLQGQIDLQKGELDLYRYNLSMRELGVAIRIVDNRFSFDGRARMGTGQVAMNGDLAWHDQHPVGRLHLQGENLQVANLPEYKVTASPNLDFKVDGRRVDATGEVVIPTAHIEPHDLRGAVQASRDARLVGEIPEPPMGGFDVHSEVRVRIGQDVHLDTYGLQGKLGGAVVINTDGQNSIGQGELNVAEGRYEAYGRKLDIARGRLLFESSPLGDPGLDIQAARKIEDTRVGVNVRGTLRSPRITLFSEPGLPQAQIVSMLLTGKPIADLSSKDAAAVSAAQNDLRLQGGTVLASQLGRRIGLEDVSFESNGVNDTSLVLGKFLSPKIFVSYGISLTESINTLKLRYTITDRWLFKTEAGQNQSADIEYRIER